MVRSDGARDDPTDDQVPPYQAHCELITVSVADIPEYLHDSAFYRALSTDEDAGNIEIPRKCYKEDTSVNCSHDLAQLLDTMIFWIMDEIPFSVFEFRNHDLEAWSEGIEHLPDDTTLRDELITFCSNQHSTKVSLASSRKGLLRYWLQTHPPDKDGILGIYYACDGAVERGDHHMLKELHNLGYILTSHMCIAASTRGHYDCLKYLHENGCELSMSSCLYAITNGHLECLRYHHEHSFPLDRTYYWKSAYTGGHFHCLKYLHENGCPWDDYCICDVAYGSLDCFRYVLQQGYAIRRDAFLFSVGSNLCIEHLQLLFEFGAYWDEQVALAAISHPIEYLIFLVTHGCPYKGTELMIYAILSEKVQHLKYLVEDVLLKMSSELYSLALILGNVECLQYLVDSGCPCEFYIPDAYRHTAGTERDTLLCFQYAIEHGCPCNEPLLHFVHVYVAQYSQMFAS